MQNPYAPPKDFFLGFGLSTFYVVDARMGPLAALAESWKATRGHKLQILIFICAATLVYMLGLLACCVGALPASGMLYVAWAMIYMRLSGYERSPFETQGS